MCIRDRTALSAARSLQKFVAPLSRGGRRKRRASRGAYCARICIVRGSEFSADSEPRRGSFGPSG
eukprot:12275520-Alexandrium_andersonii.AAC.1